MMPSPHRTHWLDSLFSHVEQRIQSTWGQRLLRQGGFVAVAALLIWAINLNLGSLVANFYYSLSQQTLMAGEQVAPSTEKSAIQTAFSQLESAQSWQPGNPDILFEMGNLQLQMASQAADAKQKQIHLKRAMVYYQTLLTIRPTWSYGWINLAMTRARLGEKIEVVEQDLERAIILAPFDVSVQQGVLKLGFHLWDKLSPEMIKHIRSINNYLYLEDWQGTLKLMISLGHIQEAEELVFNDNERAAWLDAYLNQSSP
uniref:Uncharacterized protein n=1 Tax=Magnetococcus massalia (strain MO-1) TaxID=451514 RepID=A0A1S7LHQ0_MAGMO|nr:conserved protein of unknown function [Candidatus Magnetococcus massalia]